MKEETFEIGYMLENDFLCLGMGDDGPIEVFSDPVSLKNFIFPEYQDAYNAQKVYKVKVSLIEIVKEGEE